MACISLDVNLHRAGFLRDVPGEEVLPVEGQDGRAKAGGVGVGVWEGGDLGVDDGPVVDEVGGRGNGEGV